MRISKHQLLALHLILHVSAAQVASLRKTIYEDGYVLFQAPWEGYNNMNFVIAKRTPALQRILDKHGWNVALPDAMHRPRFNKEVRNHAISAEVSIP